jgi:hypothetical protein
VETSFIEAKFHRDDIVIMPFHFPSSKYYKILFHGWEAFADGRPLHLMHANEVIDMIYPVYTAFIDLKKKDFVFEQPRISFEDNAYVLRLGILEKKAYEKRMTRHDC